jgi:type I restriction enzyme S subunit
LSVTSGVGLVSQQEKFGRTIAGKSYKNYFLIQRNDFAYNKSATKEFPQGFIAMYSGNERASVPNSIFTCFRVDEDRLNVDYLNYLFFGNLHGRWLRKYITVGARAHGSLSINDEDLMSMPIPRPSGKSSLFEQQQIAECLSSLDAVIAAQSERLDALKTHRKGLLQQLFPRKGETRPRLRFPEFTQDNEWGEDQLGNLVDIKSGDSPSKYALGSHGKYALVKVEDLNNCAKYQRSGREYSDDPGGVVPIDSILFPKRGAAIELNKIRITASEILIDTNLMAITPNGRATVEFLYYYLINVGLAQIADTSTIPQINNKHIIPYRIQIPSKSEQERIGSCLSSLDDGISAQAQELIALQNHKRGLMQQLFLSPDEVEA